jgi:ABC-type uncharacterized transport system ATPase subunit
MIRVDGLVKKFGDFTAVDNISFEVPKGEIFAFLGPNGVKNDNDQDTHHAAEGHERNGRGGRAQSDDARE